MKRNKSNKLIVLSLVLFVLVMIGIYTMQGLDSFLYEEQQDVFSPFIPLVVFTGFFIFIIAAILFAYGIINSLKN